MAQALPANVGPAHLQQLQDKDTSTIPLFYGNQKDTVTLQCFINRIDTGIRTLNWTQHIAFTYFQNATRSTAAAWLESFLTDNTETPHEWQTVFFVVNLTMSRTFVERESVKMPLALIVRAELTGQKSTPMKKLVLHRFFS